MLHRSTARGPLVLPPGSDQPTLLSGAAAAIWLLLEGPGTEADLVAQLRRAGDAAAETSPGGPAGTEVDTVAATLAALADTGLVEAEP